MSRTAQHHTLEPDAFSEEGAEAPAAAALAPQRMALPGQMLDGGEIVILALKPSMWFLVHVSVRWLLGAAIVILAAPWLVSLNPAISGRLLTQSALVLTAARLIVALLQWSSRLCVLTNRRVMSYHGVLQVSLFDSPLVQIRNTYVKAGRFERLCNIGSIGFSLTGSKRVDAWWQQIADPREVHEKIRRAIEKALDNHVPY